VNRSVTERGGWFTLVMVVHVKIRYVVASAEFESLAKDGSHILLLVRARLLSYPKSC
jgi:hypothetical protein